MILFAFEADGTKTREACRPRHRNAEKHQRLFSNPDIPAVFIYSHPPNPSRPDFHGSAEKEPPLVAETVPRPPLPMSLTATCSELFIHHYRQGRCEASLIPFTLAGSLLPLHAVGCQIVSGYAGTFWSSEVFRAAVIPQFVKRAFNLFLILTVSKPLWVDASQRVLFFGRSSGEKRRCSATDRVPHPTPASNLKCRGRIRAVCSNPWELDRRKAFMLLTLILNYNSHNACRF